MSHHVKLRCACGEAAFDGSSWFTSVVWDDVLGCLVELGITNPYLMLPSDGRQVDAAGFLAWWDDVLARMEAGRERLPVIYRVWRGNQTDVAYCGCRGRGWMVEGTYDQLAGVALAPEVWEQRRVDLGYDPPVVEDVAADDAAAFASAGDGARAEVALPADTFERIFRGTPLTLEHGRLPDFFADELRALEALARHAADRGETVGVYGD